jgi:hypothetical protein
MRVISPYTSNTCEWVEVKGSLPPRVKHIEVVESVSWALTKVPSGHGYLEYFAFTMNPSATASNASGTPNAKTESADILRMREQFDNIKNDC